MTKVRIPEGYMFGKAVKIGHSNTPIDRLLVWYNLKACDYNGLLPKGYLTKVRNGHISYNAAKNYVKKVMTNAGNPFDIQIVIDNNEYFVITFLKVS